MSRRASNITNSLLIAFISVLLISSQRSYAQSFTRTYPTALGSLGHAIRQTDDGGFLLAGHTTEPDSTGNGWQGDFFLVRTNAAGDTLWTRSYGGDLHEYAYDVEISTDGSIWLAGTASDGTPDTDVLLLRLDANGGVVWKRTFGGPGWYSVGGIAATYDGGMAVAGSIEDPGLRTYVARINSNGDTLWTHTYDTGANNAGQSIFATADSGFVISGLRHTTDPATFQIEIIRIDEDGAVLWNRVINLPFSAAYDGIETADGDLVFTGQVNDTSAFLLRTNMDGDVSWAKSYEYPEENCKGFYVRHADDGGFVISGDKNLHPWMIRTDAIGDTLWQYVHADGLKERSQVAILPDGGTAMVCFRGGIDAGMQLVRTTPDGLAPCAVHLPTDVAVLFPDSYEPIASIGSVGGELRNIDLRIGSGAFIVDPCLSMGMAHGERDVQLMPYPNPTSDRLWLGGTANVLRAEVFDHSGRLVFRVDRDRIEGALNMEALASGSYVVRCIRVDGSYSQTRFAKE